MAAIPRNDNCILLGVVMGGTELQQTSSPLDGAYGPIGQLYDFYSVRLDCT